MSQETALTSEQLWNAALPILAQRINEATYDAFVAGAVAIEYTGDRLRLGVANDFALDWLQRHHAQVIGDCIAEVAQQPVQLQMETLAADAAPPAPPAPVTLPPPETSVARAQPPSDIQAAPLNPKYTFENFVVADCNRFAHAASLQVAKNPGNAYNPLFIHSASGLGKTHLIQAIGHVIANDPALSHYRVVYISAEAFVNHMISCMRDNTIDRFRRSYRSVDCWLVDDIQFIAEIEGPASEEEFFHTFSALYETNRQVVIASDCPPRHLQLMNERLRSRLEMGIVADLRTPDIETRVAILEKKALNEGVHLSRDVLDYVAGKIESNIRVLEGALLKLCAYASLNEVEVSRELAEEIIGDYSTSHTDRRVALQDILDYVASELNCPTEDMVSKKRTQNIAWARQVAIYLARELTDNSLARIGQFFGDRDHSTILHSYNKVQDAIEQDEQILWLINDLRATFE